MCQWFYMISNSCWWSNWLHHLPSPYQWEDIIFAKYQGMFKSLWTIAFILSCFTSLILTIPNPHKVSLSNSSTSNFLNIVQNYWQNRNLGKIPLSSLFVSKPAMLKAAGEIHLPRLDQSWPIQLYMLLTNSRESQVTMTPSPHVHIQKPRWNRNNSMVSELNCVTILLSQMNFLSQPLRNSKGNGKHEMVSDKRNIIKFALKKTLFKCMLGDTLESVKTEGY